MAEVSPERPVKAQPSSRTILNPEEYEHKSCYVFDAKVFPRKQCVHMMQSPWFDRISTTIIILNCLVLALYDPLDDGKTVDQLSGGNKVRMSIARDTELWFNILFTIEMIIKIIGMGFFMEKLSYLRDPWNWLDFFIVVMGWVGMLPVGEDAAGLSAIRTFRVLRPLRTLTIMPGMKILISSMLNAVEPLGLVALLGGFIFFLFSIIGTQLFAGSMDGRCYIALNIQNADTHPNCTMSDLSNCLIDTERACLGGFEDQPDCPHDSQIFPATTQAQASDYLKKLRTNLNIVVVEDAADGDPCSIDEAFWPVNDRATASKYTGNKCSPIEVPQDPNNPDNTISVYRFCGRQRLLSQPLVEAKKGLLASGQGSKEDGPEWAEKTGTSLATLASSEMCKTRPGVDKPSQCYMNKDGKNFEAEDDTLSYSFGTGSFDDTGLAFITIFTSITLEGWVDVMYILYDSHNWFPLTAIYFILLFMLGSMLLLNLALAVIEDEYSNSEDAADDEAEESGNGNAVALSKSVEAEDSSHDVVVKVPKGGFKLFRDICTHKNFENFITFAILANTVTLAMERHVDDHKFTDGMPAAEQDALDIFNYIFTVTFTLELVIKLLGLGFREYIADKANDFDALIVLFSWIEIIIQSSGGQGAGGLSALRAFRLFRIFKLAKSSGPIGRELSKILSTLVNALTGTANAALLLLIIVFIFVLLGMKFFGGWYTDPELFEQGDMPKHHFDNIWWAFVSVFQVLTGENWNEVLYNGIAATNYNTSVIYFVLLNIGGQMIILNLFLAILLSKFDEDDEEEADEEESQQKGAAYKSGEDKQPEDDKSGVAAPSLFQKAPKSEGGSSDSDEGPKLHGKVLWFMGPEHPFRAQCYKIITHPAFDNTILILILVSSILLMLDEPWIQRCVDQFKRCEILGQGGCKTIHESNSFTAEGYFLGHLDCVAVSNTLYVLDVIMSVCFWIECALKVLSLGFVMNKGAYLRDGWNMLDFFIVVLSIVMIGGSNAPWMKSMRAIRALRALRPLRVISRYPGMRLVVNSLIRAVPRISYVLVVTMLFFLIFAVVGVQNFKGVMKVCSDDSKLCHPDYPIDPQHPAFKVWGCRDPTDFNKIVGYSGDACSDQVPFPYGTLCATDANISAIQEKINKGIINNTPPKVEDLKHEITDHRPDKDGIKHKRVVPDLTAKGIELGMLNLACDETPNDWALELGSDLSCGVLPGTSEEEECGSWAYCSVLLRISHIRTNTSHYCNTKQFSTTRKYKSLKQNFDNVGTGLSVVFEVSTGEMWPDIMYTVVDSYTGTTAETKYGQPNMGGALRFNDTFLSEDIKGAEGYKKPRPYGEQSPAVALYFMLVTVMCAFLLLNLFVGVVVDSFNDMKEEGGGMETESQKAWIEAQKLALKAGPERKVVAPAGGFRLQMFNLVEGKPFEMFIMSMIVLNVLIMACAGYGNSTNTLDVFAALNLAFVIIFTVEAALKLYALGVQEYFVRNWNRFDFTLVVLSYVGIVGGGGSLASLFRIFRVARMFRLVQSSKGLLNMFKTILLSVPAISNVFMVTMLLFFIFAILGMNLLSGVKLGDNLGKFSNFDGFFRSMMLLFRMSTGESYNGVMYDALLDPLKVECFVEKVPSPTTPGELVDEDNCGPPHAVTIIYFLVFFVMSNLLMWNLVVAIILDNFGESQDSSNLDVTEEDMNTYKDAWADVDPKATGLIPLAKVPTFVMSLAPPLGLKTSETPSETEIGELRKKARNLIKKMDIPDRQGNVSFHELLSALVSRAGPKISQKEMELMAASSGFHDLQLQKSNIKILKKDDKQAKKLGLVKGDGDRFTVEEAAASGLMQAAWRGSKARNQVAEKKRESTAPKTAGPAATATAKKDPTAAPAATQNADKV